MIIGITGTNHSGKGAVAQFLKDRGFKHYSVREYLKKILEEKGLQTDRSNMILMANQLRSKHGAGFIVEELYKQAVAAGGDAIIESVRAVGEVEALRKKPRFILFAVDADPEIRYARLVDTGKNKEFSSFEDFLQQEEVEMHSLDKAKQNLRRCIEMADHLFTNEWSQQELYQKVQAVLGNRGSGVQDYVRPTWDEYFMDIAKVVAKRGTCDRERYGCVIAKDKQLMVTGYVGSPSGMPHCDEAGHQMEQRRERDGKTKDYCVRTTHAEQNALCQAAMMGIALKGASAYCTVIPCFICAKLLVNAGIGCVVYASGENVQSQQIFEQAGVDLRLL